MESKSNIGHQTPIAIDTIDEYFIKLGMTLKLISRQEILTVIDILFNAWINRKNIFLCGNGGSAATASHMANDFNKLTIFEGKPRFKATALTDNIPLLTAWSNDLSFNDAFSQQLINFVEPGDIVIGISTSGESENVLRAVQVAKDHQAITIGITGDKGGRLKKAVHHCIYIPDDNIFRQEDGHLILDHIISSTLREMIAEHSMLDGADQ